MLEAHRPRRRRAFSLLELVLVVAILAVLAAIAAPRFAVSEARYRVEAAANRIIHDLALARARARTRGESQAVNFHVHDNRYEIPGMTGLESQSDYSFDLDEQFHRAEIVSASFAGDARIVYNGHGLPDSGGTIVVRVGDLQRVIVVDPDLGKGSLE